MTAVLERCAPSAGRVRSRLRAVAACQPSSQAHSNGALWLAAALLAEWPATRPSRALHCRRRPGVTVAQWAAQRLRFETARGELADAIGHPVQLRWSERDGVFSLPAITADADQDRLW